MAEQNRPPKPVAPERKQTMATPKLELNPDTFAVRQYVSVKGITTKQRKEGEAREGSALTVNGTFEKHTSDVYEAADAECLKNKLRSCFAKHVVTVGGGLEWTITTKEKLAEFYEERRSILDDIETHNARVQFHAVEQEFSAVPLALAASPETAQSIYNDCAERLDAVRGHFARGDVAAISAWVQRNKNLSAFLPSVTANLADEAIQQVREGLTSLRGQATEAKNKNQTFDPASAGQALLADGSLGALDNARGLVNPNVPNASPVTLAIVA
jgi:hypothetical protein